MGTSRNGGVNGGLRSWLMSENGRHIEVHRTGSFGVAVCIGGLAVVESPRSTDGGGLVLLENSLMLLTLKAMLVVAVTSGTYADVVREQFPKWDLNRDGRLEAREIDELVTRHNIEGEPAAALAVLKLAERRTPAAKRENLAYTIDEAMKPDGKSEKSNAADSARGAKTMHPEEHFQHNVKMLQSLNPHLYAGKGPDFQSLRQGEIGDCYFFSIAGELAARQPDRIKKMIVPEANGGFLVQCPDGEKLRIAAPSQAEMLVNNSGSTLTDGIWVVVLEKALGEHLRSHAKKPAAKTAEATDAMAQGGTSEGVIHLFSGHGSKQINLRDPKKSRERMEELRRELAAVLERGLRAGVEMDRNPPSGHQKIPGLGYNHAYAILEFNPKTEEVTVWNPWGNNFEPKGAPGVEHGFPSQHGVFKIPLSTLYQQFSQVILESPEAAKPHSLPNRRK